MTRWKLVRDPTKYTGSLLRKPTHRFFAFSYSLSGVVICWGAPRSCIEAPYVSVRSNPNHAAFSGPAPAPDFRSHVIPGPI